MSTAQSIWNNIHTFVASESTSSPLLERFFKQSIMQHASLTESLAWIIASKLCCDDIPFVTLHQAALSVFSEEDTLQAICEDLEATFTRDGACQHIANAFMFYKGFHALETHRIAHALCLQNKKALAFLFQSKSSSVFDVDIHPAAIIGKGVMLDHATGIVVGETARIGDNVSIMQGVTLGGTGKEHDDRHPKIGNGVLISCGASILGNIHLGEGSKIAAGSVVLNDVKPNTTVAGVPAKSIGKTSNNTPALSMDHKIDCDSVNLALKKE